MKSFYYSLHLLRGFAAFSVIAYHVHAFYLSTVDAEILESPYFGPVYAASKILFSDPTIYFAVISGTLHQLVLYRKSYYQFVADKIRFFLLPYAIFSVIFVSISYVQSGVYPSIGGGCAGHI